MLSKLSHGFNTAKARASQMWRDHKDRQEAKKATAALHSEHGHGRFFLLTVPALATLSAAVVEVYWAVLFCIEATGRLDGNFDMAAAWNDPGRFVWDFAFSGNAPVLIGLLAATMPIVMISMVWLPVQFAMRGHGRWRRGSLIAVGLLCNAIVIISGTVVMNHNRQEQVRDSLVVEQSADADRAAIGARLQVAQTELARITAEGNTSNEARAARAGVEGWRTYVREAQRDPGVPAADRQRIERAMGSAEAADRLRARIEELTVQQAVAAPTASTAVTVADDVGAGMNSFSESVKVYRPPLVAVAATLIGILGAWWTLAMMLGMNPRDVLRSGWADEGHRIEDLREEEPIAPQPMRPAREVVTDAETGEELIKITPKPHWRKQKGKKQKVETNPEIPPDETGVDYDGGGRSGSVGKTASEVQDGPDDGATERQVSDDAAEPQPSVELTEHSDSPDTIYTDEDIAALEEIELAAGEPVANAEPVVEVAEQEHQKADDESNSENPSDDAERDFPEEVDHSDTPISDERRLITAK